MGLKGSLMSQMLLAVSSTICWLKKRAFNFFSLPQTSWRTDWAWEPVHNPEGLTRLWKEKDSCWGPALFQKYTQTTTWDSNKELFPQREVVVFPTDDSSARPFMDFSPFKDEAKGACFIHIMLTLSHVRQLTKFGLWWMWNFKCDLYICFVDRWFVREFWPCVAAPPRCYFFQSNGCTFFFF